MILQLIASALWVAPAPAATPLELFVHNGVAGASWVSDEVLVRVEPSFFEQDEQPNDLTTEQWHHHNTQHGCLS